MSTKTTKAVSAIATERCADDREYGEQLPEPRRHGVGLLEYGEQSTMNDGAGNVHSGTLKAEKVAA